MNTVEFKTECTQRMAAKSFIVWRTELEYFNQWELNNRSFLMRNVIP